MKLSRRLSPVVIDALKPEAVPYRVWDTLVPQLHLRIQPSAVKSWNVAWDRNRSASLGKWPGVTVESARTKARAILAEVDRHGAPLTVIEANKPERERPITLAGFIERHFEPWAVGNLKDARPMIKALRCVWGSLYERRIDELVALDVECIKNQRLKAGRAAATVNRDLDRIRSVLSRACDWGFLQAHPLKPVKRLKGAESHRVRYLSADEEKRLRGALAAREAERRASRERHNAWHAERGSEGHPQWPEDGFSDHLTPIVLLALNTGLRRGELLALAWRDVDLEPRRAVLTVTAGNAKSRKARHVPLNAEALGVLARWRRQNPNAELVFPGPNGGRMGGIQTAWESLVAAAELVDFRFHDLRHTFASRLVMAGVDLNTVRELLGHADISMTMRYAHLAPERLAAAVAVLDAREKTEAGAEAQPSRGKTAA